MAECGLYTAENVING